MSDKEHKFAFILIHNVSMHHTGPYGKERCEENREHRFKSRTRTDNCMCMQSVSRDANLVQELEVKLLFEV